MKHVSTICLLRLMTIALGCSRAALDIDTRSPCPESCDDGMFCNGIETCDLETGTCVPPAELFSCDDDDECTIDSCNETAARCDHRPERRDNDFDGFNACDDDCDDDNAQVHPGATELCNMIDKTRQRLG